MNLDVYNAANGNPYPVLKDGGQKQASPCGRGDCEKEEEARHIGSRGQESVSS